MSKNKAGIFSGIPLGRSGKFLAAAALVVLSASRAFAATVTDEATSIIYEIIDGTDEVRVYKEQSLQSYYGALTIPATITDTNTTSVNYGKTYRVTSIAESAFKDCPMESMVIEAQVPEIPMRAFYGCENMQSIVLPESITTIGWESFYSCGSLKSVTTGPNLQKIDYRAFGCCWELQTVDMTQSTSLQYIGESAFEYCSELKCPDFPDSLLRIGRRAFYYCYGLGDVKIPPVVEIQSEAFSGATITSLEFPGTDGWTMNESGGLPGGYQFLYATMPEMVIIPASATYLPTGAFSYCYGLKKVVMSDNPELRIGESCFRYSNLEEVVFEGSVSEIGAQAFEGVPCVSLAIPPCNKIGNMAFSSMTRLTSVTFPEEAIPSANLGTGIFSSCRLLPAIELPDWMEVIPGSMFEMCGWLSSVTFPASLKGINSAAFKSCSELELPDKPFPEGLEYVGDEAFYGAYGIGKLTLPVSLQWIGESAFRECPNLELENFESLTALKSIGKSAFRECSGMTSLVFPPNLKSVGEIADWTYKEHSDDGGSGAFEDCINLRDVVFNANVALGNYCFYRSGIERVDWAEGMTAGIFTFSKCPDLTEVNIPGTVEVIPPAVFELSPKLTKLTLNSGTKEIKERAFAGTGLIDIDWGGDFPTLEVIGHTAFADCQFGSLGFPPSLKSIGENAFFRSGVTDVVIPATINEIGSHAFSANPLKSITWPEYPDYDVSGATVGSDLPLALGTGVFTNTPIENVILPSWMVNVPGNLFAQEPKNTDYSLSWVDGIHTNAYGTRILDVYNNSLKSIEFPEYVLSVGSGAFSGNRSLVIGEFPHSIILYGGNCFFEGGKDLTTQTITDPESGATTEEEVYLGTIYARDDTEFVDEAFSNAKIQSIVFEGCATFGEGCFANMKYISEIEFPECLTRIPDGFCDGWTKLEDVRFRGNKVVEIGKKAFANCPVINDIDFTTLPYLEKIEDQAFRNSSQSTVKFPEHPVEFGDSVFASCMQLEEVALPSYLSTVPDGMFKNCIKLSSVNFESISDRFTVGVEAFYNTGITRVKMPQTELYLDKGAFAQCRSLTTFEWPSGEHKVELSDEGYQFHYCLKLDMPSVPVSVTRIPESMFNFCLGLTTIELPSVEYIGKEAFYSSNVQNVHIGTNCPPRPLVFGPQSFKYTSRMLKSISMPCAPSVIDTEAFLYSSLENFIVNDLTPEYSLNTIGKDAFMGCSSLKEFPDICAPGATIGNQAFFGCTSLKRILISPNFGHDKPGNGVFDAGKTTNLQSIEFYGSPFQVFPSDVSGRNPLQALSYFKLPEPDADFRLYAPSTTKASTLRVFPAKLMVPRATRYQFHEIGYQNDQLFDIEEIKDPRLELFGEIFSKFSVGESVNHYTGVLRWQMELSDLNDSGQTEYELWRDGRKAASFVFEAPEVETDISDGSVSTDKAISVAFRAYDPEGNDITEKLTYGDFYYEKSPNYFIPTIQTAQKKVYFNSESTARIGQTDGLGRTSWFLYKDNFDSPELDGFNVPVSHTYVLKMKNYDYMEWENYPDLEPDADGNYYRKVPKRTGNPGEEWMVSEPCVVYTSIAHPSLAIDGLYTEEQVKADLDRALDVTTVPENAKLVLRYIVAGDACDHKVYDTTSPYGRYIVDNVQAYNLGSRYQTTTSANAWGDPVDVKGVRENVIAGPETAVVPGYTTFQTVTYADYRGSFGSPKVTLLGAPTLELEVSEVEETPLHLHYDPFSRIRRFEVKLKPEVAMFGYDDMENPLTSDKYFVGLWRNVTTREWNSARAVSEPVTESTLIWHSDGEVPQEWMANCDYCKEGIGYDPSTRVYTDRVKCVNLTASDITYTARIYVKKPDEPDRYAIAESLVANPSITTGIDDVTADMTPEDMEYILANGHLYNLQGIQISNPAKGQVVIAMIDGRVVKLKI